MTSTAIDWQALRRLRKAFLEGAGGVRDYWRSDSDLANYDETFAQRIGWKWDFVLNDLRQRHWTPPSGEWLDWGCGTGIAARACLDHFGSHATQRLRLFDRSEQALRFAEKRVRDQFPGLEVVTGLGRAPAEGTALPSPSSGGMGGMGEEAPRIDEGCRPEFEGYEKGASTAGTSQQLLLISHVLTELTSAQLESLVGWLKHFTAVLWVEPGTRDASRALIDVRERVRGSFQPIAPCVHALRCGILALEDTGHWCHQFAPPPPEIFSDPFWTRFGKELEIDLRSVPLSYLVLDRRPQSEAPGDQFRVLGRPRLNKADVRFLACAPEGVKEYQLQRRDFPEAWREVRRHRFNSLQPRPARGPRSPPT